MTRPSSAASTVGIRSRALRFAPRRSDWSRATIGRDLSAGLMVALVALPSHSASALRPVSARRPELRRPSSRVSWPQSSAVVTSK